MLRRKTRWVDSAEHYFQVRLGRRSLALLHFFDDAPQLTGLRYSSEEAGGIIEAGSEHDRIANNNPKQ